jgi:catechol 2,3-dioxygenase-like lactoylglutathione lyase family enzyme
MLERIDHLVGVVADLERAGAAYERLGLVLTPPFRFEDSGLVNRAMFVGESPQNFFYLELISVFDSALAEGSGRSAYVGKEGALALGFGVTDVREAAGRLTQSGYETSVESVNRPDGSRIIDVAPVDTRGEVPFRVSVLQYPEPWDSRFERSKAAGRFEHTFPLKRLDHLAAVAPDLEAATRFWGDIFGVPVSGEIRTDALVIRQLRIGDAILELLGPTSPDSPMASRPPSLASVAAWEVDGRLDDAIMLARSRGFTCPDAEAGVIPGTRRATIAAGELGGVAMQLLEYV